MCSFHKFVDLINFGQARQFWKNSDWLIELLKWIFFFERERMEVLIWVQCIMGLKIAGPNGPVLALP